MSLRQKNTTEKYLKWKEKPHAAKALGPGSAFQQEGVRTAGRGQRDAARQGAIIAFQPLMERPVPTWDAANGTEEMPRFSLRAPSSLLIFKYQKVPSAYRPTSAEPIALRSPWGFQPLLPTVCVAHAGNYKAASSCSRHSQRYILQCTMAGQSQHYTSHTIPQRCQETHTNYTARRKGWARF